MVIKNRCTNNTLQRMDHEIKPDLMLCTQNKMLPALQSVPPKMTVPNYSFPILKPKIIQLSKHENRPVSLFLQEPPSVFHNKHEKVYQLNYKPKIQKQQYTIRDKSASLKTSVCDTLEKFYKSRKLIQKKKEKHLPFPNTINLLNTEYSSHEKINNYNEKSSIPALTLKLSSTTQQKQKGHNQLYGNIQSIKKQTFLYKNKNKVHSPNTFPPVSHKTFQKKQQTNTNYFNTITTKFDHIQNKNLSNSTKLTSLKTRTTNDIDSSSSTVPIDQLVFCNVIESELCTKNNIRKESDEIKNKANFNYSEQMVKITNYENKTLEMCHHKIYNLTSNIDARDIKKSMSAIQYKESSQCILDIKNNISDPYIVQNKYSNQKNKPRLKIQLSLKDTNRIPMPKKDIYTATKYEIKNNTKYRESGHDCKIKYSWQVIGTSCQTSNVLLYNFLEENKNQVYNYVNKPSIYKCNVKYSWQIIGTGTQVSLQSDNNTDHCTGIVFKSNAHQDNKVINSEKKKEGDNDIRLYKVQQCEKNIPMLNNQYTQTLITKEIQSYYTNCNVKYSWQNLVWEHL